MKYAPHRRILGKIDLNTSYRRLTYLCLCSFLSLPLFLSERKNDRKREGRKDGRKEWKKGRKREECLIFWNGGNVRGVVEALFHLPGPLQDPLAILCSVNEVCKMIA
jgi:hypothetical protein